CSHLGVNANFACRICKVGGKTRYKKTAEGFASLFTVGEPRTVMETKQAVQQMLTMASTVGQLSKADALKRQLGVADKVAEPVLSALRRLSSNNKAPKKRLQEQLTDLLESRGGYLAMNTLLSLQYLDVHRQTPVESLHTMLLGNVKYMWTWTCHALSPTGTRDDDTPHRPVEGTPMAVLEMRLNCLSRSGLEGIELHPSYICKYKRALNGKYFRALVQLMPFVVWDLLSPDAVEAWVLLGLAFSLIWTYNIQDKDAH
ncbi:hypothetical protein CALCODRAFT_419414, partial [Calocera cornea HHB12733]